MTQQITRGAEPRELGGKRDRSSGAFRHIPYTAPVAVQTHTPAPSLRGVSTLDLLKAEAFEAVRITRDYADGLTAKDHDLLKAFSKGQYLTGVLRFMEIGLKCNEVSAATALPEALRGFTVRHHPRAHVCYLEAFGTESLANGEFDATQIAFAADPSEANRRRAIEAGTRQLAETHRALNALHRVGGG